MKLLSIFQFFSLYEGPFEKKVDRFLEGIRRKTKADLELLMQEDLVRLTIFLEYKFKGYKKLKKTYRKKLYENARLIVRDFEAFSEANEVRIRDEKRSLNLPPNLLQDEHMNYLLLIMNYLKLDQRLHYQEAATFEKLLRDPHTQKLIGDCNQITTLYIYLFSLKYPISELRVKILPEHICLHYKGIDIETTNASLTHYADYTFLSEVTEIVAANILDVSDPEEGQFQISPSNMLKSANLAYQFSSHRATVEKNLFAAYHNLAIYYAKQKNFSQAILYANKSGNTILQRDVIRMEGVSLLKQKKYEQAVQRFRKVSDIEGEKACWQNELADLFEKTKTFKTVQQYKGVKSTLRRMKELALKLNNQKVVTFVNDLFDKF